MTTKLAAAVATSLAALVAATNAEPYYMFATEGEMADLLKAGFAEGPNKEIVDPATADKKDKDKKYAFRATAAGLAALKEDQASGDNTTPTPAPATGAAAAAPAFKIVKGIAMPTVSRNLDNQGKYPFADLGHDEAGNGDSFFIPAGDKKSPSKSFGSVVSQANKRFALKGDFRHFTTRTMLGDNWGQPGVKGVAVFRDSKTEEAKLKAEAEKAGTLK